MDSNNGQIPILPTQNSNISNIFMNIGMLLDTSDPIPILPIEAADKKHAYSKLL